MSGPHSQHDFAAEADDILLGAGTSRDAISELYRAFKACNPKMSSTLLAKRLHLSSRGNATDILGGRRLLPKRCLKDLVATFGLSSPQERCLTALLDVDHSRSSSGSAIARQGLALARRAMAMTRIDMPPATKHTLTAFKVFCAIDLLDDEATREKLYSTFTEMDSGDIDASIDFLERHELIYATEQKSYKLKNEFLMFKGSQDNSAHIDFLKLTFLDAYQHVQKWFRNSEESLFQSMVFSVDREKYIMQLPKIRDWLQAAQADLEGESNTTMIHFNVQIYPALDPPTQQQLSPN